MVLWAILLLINGVTSVGCVPWAATPENITVMFLTPSEVRVSWRTAAESVEKYDVTYKPTDASYRVVVVVAGNSESVTLTGLQANTQYQVVITAVTAGKKFRSRPVVFRTLERVGGAEQVQITGGPPPLPKGRTIPPHPNTNPPYVQGIYQVRGIEVGIVCLVLMVWIGAIALFFNRWGKIRMLLPYQPDYKETQLKVPGATATTCQPTSCQNNASSPFCCSQRWTYGQGYEGSPVASGAILSGGGMRVGRSRINSAVYLCHHRSEEAEPLCRSPPPTACVRKTKSADHLAPPPAQPPPATTPPVQTSLAQPLPTLITTTTASTPQPTSFLKPPHHQLS